MACLCQVCVHILIYLLFFFIKLHNLTDKTKNALRVLIAGPNSCGKHTLVNAIAKEIGAHYLHIYDTYWSNLRNECFMKLDAIFTLASKLQPANVVIFIEGIENIFPQYRKYLGTDLTPPFMQQWQKAMQKRERVLLVGTTTNTANISPRALSCLNMHICLKAPDLTTRVCLLKKFLKVCTCAKLFFSLLSFYLILIISSFFTNILYIEW